MTGQRTAERVSSPLSRDQLTAIPNKSAPPTSRKFINVHDVKRGFQLTQLTQRTQRIYERTSLASASSVAFAPYFFAFIALVAYLRALLASSASVALRKGFALGGNWALFQHQ